MESPPRYADAREIIALWPSKRLLGEDTKRSHITVHSWWQRNSIPAEVDVDLVAGARRRGLSVDFRDLALLRAVEPVK